ncbi:lipopolysaccharide transport system ATP-binding protein [Rhodopseudomonas thermotolerans]|uniref:Lipopolysaccharide transport system ATP-binding protein n=2 Tax=Rhodopseudomonas TaxID=1073 RepID=A0A336JJX5_9BRAD|nr:MULTISPECIES: ABC transporter ATP-binding protein [Rhodopseudomonas]RED37982.1 lipopolysaccharide transport system ATP-binding protein [Rhodopseudomonas pentothenatexigens]REG05175.1 lipopolysaccharide transport system ATP-binding protein [Rhodopseudomonas thermotolerans]SSW90007.1 lipopolysaccharide transport system ATP-binding protein [Rhodopseudomonas pentothenatexigens]
MSKPVISIEKLGKQYKVGGKPFWALRDITLDVKRGEVLGIVGRNGAGKTTLLRILSRITDPTHGKAVIRGRVSTLLETGTGFHPDLSGRENIYLNGAILGMRPQEVKRRMEEIVEFSGVGKFIDAALKSYSSGMRSRLTFAVAAHLETEVLMIDEVLAVGDIAFQEKCLAKINDLTREDHRTVLFVSHSMGAIQSLCSSAILIEDGTIVAKGETEHVVAKYNSLLLGPKGSTEMTNTAGRPGSGTVRLTGMQLEDLDGKPITSVPAGSGARLVFDYVSVLDQEVRDVIVTVVIVGSKGFRLFGMPSDIIRSKLTLSAKSGQFVCTLPQLPLLPGHYDIVASVLVNRELADKIQNMCHLPVSHNDYYGTGRIQQGAMGDGLIDFSWDVRNGGPEPSSSSVASRESAV